MSIERKYNRLIELFKEVSSIPRNSGEEGRIAEYLCEFAKARNLWYKKDEYNNVIIKKEAPQGSEDKKAILFQAHTDMVCEKTETSSHDFTKDPIELIIDGDIIKAKDTTLGADDGIGVAFLLLMLEEENNRKIECLFTTEEETGMDGAKSFKYEDIDSSYLINLDGEEEDTAIVGCAGGVKLNYTKKVEIEKVNINGYKLSISNLAGGHSGVDIDKKRVNANFLMASVLKNLKNVRIESFNGGTKDNAIARSASCTFYSESKDIKASVNSIITIFKFVSEDKNLKVNIEEVELKNLMSKEDSMNVLDILLTLKQGVIDMSKSKDGLVESSGNIGKVEIENGNISIIESLRSSIDIKRDEYKLENNNIAKKYGYEVLENGEYPGWQYKEKSKLRDEYIKAYKLTHDEKEPIICAIHAGVECGIIYEKLPHLDMISLGPDVKNVHTTEEILELNSCKKLIKTLDVLMNNLD